jgi:hypothetical protein
MLGWMIYPIKSVPVYRDLPVPRKRFLYKSTIRDPWLDRVYLQEVMVPKWVREEKETAYIQDNKTKITVPICALGGSIATAKTGLTEVCILKELKDKIKGKIVFFNRMNNEEIESFHVFGQV